MSGVCPDCLVRAGHSGGSLTRLPVVSGMLDAVLQQAKGRCAHGETQRPQVRPKRMLVRAFG